MKIAMLGSAMALAMVLAACGAKQDQVAANASETATAADPAAAAGTFYGRGTVHSIDGDQVAITHGPIAGIGWPAMTMTFTAPPPMAGALKVGEEVNFSFQRLGGSYLLTSVRPR